MITLLLGPKEFKIPSDFRFLEDINQEIYAELKNNKYYIVQSSVQPDIFESFIKYWKTKEIPYFNINNISEYEELSHEFDIMSESIQIFQNFIDKSSKSSFYIKNQNLHKIIEEKNEEKEQKIKNYQKINDILFKNNENDSNFRFLRKKRKLFHYCIDENAKFVDLLTRKEVIQNGLSFVLFENEKEATVFRNLTTKSAIFIPKSIIYESKEYIITSITEGAFKNSKQIKFVNFDEDSQLRFIDKFSFENSTIFSISIPSTVRYIGESAFSECRNLFIINFCEQSELESIEKNVFNHAPFSEIFIPPKVTRICEKAFNYCDGLTNLTFSKNSELKVIEKNAFYFSSLDKILIPSSVTKLQKGWCKSSKLNKVDVTKENKNFKIFDNNFLIGKSYPKNKSFNVLFFAQRNIQNVKIPSFIKHIASSAFHRCKLIQKVEFSKDSELQSIGDSSFANSSLKSIKIPPHVKKIGEHAFFNCQNLSSLTFSENSELISIEQNTFSFCNLMSLTIPSSVKKLKKGWCHCSKFINIDVMLDNKFFKMHDGKFLIGKSSQKNKNFDVLHFAPKNIEKAIIPSFIKEIAPFAFEECRSLQEIEFSDDSELQTIGANSFSNSIIESIKMPSHVTKICECAFFSCYKLAKIEFSENSELNSIGSSFCSFSLLESLSIPSNLVELDDEWCYELHHLNKIEIMPNNSHFVYFDNKLMLGKSDSKSEIFDVIQFARRNVVEVVIPSFIKRIARYAFGKCIKLKKVEFEKNSNLEIIDFFAFEVSSIESITIPSNVKKINFAFCYCNKLKNVWFSANSKLKSIGQSSFFLTSIQSISIPDSVCQIEKSAFASCKDLQIFEISDNSNLEQIDLSIFSNSYGVIIMIPTKLKDIIED